MTLDTAMKADHAELSMRSILDGNVDSYFSADVETDGPIPGPYSMLSLL
jgi:hypothetical protein